MAETSDTSRKITYEILKPLQNPNKAKSPLSSLRPIILVFPLSKSLAAFIINRIEDKFDEEIPPSQASYRPN